jgi:preprotein translocase subunit SecY
MLIEWLAAAAVLLVFLPLLPRMLRRAKAMPRKSGGSGVMIAIGVAFSMIFDAKASQAMEVIDRKKDIGDSEDGESGERAD